MGKKLYLTKQFYYFSNRIHKKYTAKPELRKSQPSWSFLETIQALKLHSVSSKSLKSEFDMNSQQSKFTTIPHLHKSLTIIRDCLSQKILCKITLQWKMNIVRHNAKD